MSKMKNHTTFPNIFLSKTNLYSLLAILLLNPAYAIQDQPDLIWTDDNIGPISYPSASAACEDLSSYGYDDFTMDHIELMFDPSRNLIAGQCILKCNWGNNCQDKAVLSIRSSPLGFVISTPEKDKPIDKKTCVGNPIDPVSGNKYQQETLIENPDPKKSALNYFTIVSKRKNGVIVIAPV